MRESISLDHVSCMHIGIVHQNAFWSNKSVKVTHGW